MKYMIEFSDSFFGLSDNVRIWLSRGWKPLGGVAVADRRYYQALIKEDAKPLKSRLEQRADLEAETSRMNKEHLDPEKKKQEKGEHLHAN